MGYGQKTYVLNLVSDTGYTGSAGRYPFTQNITNGFQFNIAPFIQALRIDTRKKHWVKVNQFRFNVQALDNADLDTNNTVIVNLRGFNQTNAFTIEMDNTNPVSSQSTIILHAGSNTTYEHSHGGETNQHPNLQLEYCLVSKPVINGYFDQSMVLTVFFTGMNILTQNPPAVLENVNWTLMLEFVEDEEDD